MTMSRKAKALQFANEEYSIHITGRHIQVTEAMKAYAIEKVSKMERYSNRITDLNVILDIQKLEHRAEIIMKIGSTKITALGVSNDMYVSIDMAVDKIEAQLRRYNSRLHDHHAKSHADLTMNVNVIRRSPEEEMNELEIEAEAFNNVKHEVVKQKTLPLKILTLPEAVMKMELSGDSFLVYKSEEDQKLKIIYRRRDNNFGVIEPSC